MTTHDGFAVYETELTTLKITYSGDHVTGIGFSGGSESGQGTPSEVSDEAIRQIKDYLAGERREFDIPIELIGTPFQKRVWEELRRIPYGETRTYKDIASAAGSPKAFRAVGMACNKNPVAIAIPCHRVVGSAGTLVGYAGGLDIKRQLLQLENGKINPGK